LAKRPLISLRTISGGLLIIENAQMIESHLQGLAIVVAVVFVMEQQFLHFGTRQGFAR